MLRKTIKQRAGQVGLALATLAISTVGLTVGMPLRALATVANPQPTAKVSFTFDDGFASAITKAAPVLNEFGFTGTSYVTTGWVGQPNYLTWAQVAKLQNTYRWEIGSHTVTHPELTQISAAQLEGELVNSRQALLMRGITPTSFAPPFGDYDNRVLASTAKYYSSMRPFWDTTHYNGWPYNDYLLYVKQVQSGVTLEQVKTYINEAKQQKAWLVLVFHDIVDKPNPDPQSYEYGTAALRDIAAYVKSQNLPVTKMTQGLVRSTTNLLPNSSFNNGLASGWHTDDPTLVKMSTINKGNYPSSRNSIVLNASPKKNVHLFSPTVAVTSSSTYMLKTFLNVETLTSGEVSFYIDEYDQNGTWLSGQYKKGERSQFVESLNFTYKPTSPGVKQAILQIGVSQASGIKAYVDNVQWFSLN